MHAHPRVASLVPAPIPMQVLCLHQLSACGGWVSGRWGLSFRGVYTHTQPPVRPQFFPTLLLSPQAFQVGVGGGKNFSKKLRTYSGGLKGFNSGEDMGHIPPVARGPHKGGGPQVRACRASLAALHSPITQQDRHLATFLESRQCQLHQLSQTQ